MANLAKYAHTIRMLDNIAFECSQFFDSGIDLYGLAEGLDGYFEMIEEQGLVQVDQALVDLRDVACDLLSGKLDDKSPEHAERAIKKVLEAIEMAKPKDSEIFNMIG